MTEWIKWHGGDNPLPVDAVVLIECKTPEGEAYYSKPILARRLDWAKQSGITAYKIVRLDGIV